jgi:hypothetical protein
MIAAWGQDRGLLHGCIALIPRYHIMLGLVLVLTCPASPALLPCLHRLLPKAVIKVHNEAEVQVLLALAGRHQVPLTFRAAGTSLSGQAITDSILVKLSHVGRHFRGYDILVGGGKARGRACVRGRGVWGGWGGLAAAKMGYCALVGRAATEVVCRGLVGA